MHVCVLILYPYLASVYAVLQTCRKILVWKKMALEVKTPLKNACGPVPGPNNWHSNASTRNDPECRVTCCMHFENLKIHTTSVVCIQLHTAYEAGHPAYELLSMNNYIQQHELLIPACTFLCHRAQQLCFTSSCTHSETSPHWAQQN